MLHVSLCVNIQCLIHRHTYIHTTVQEAMELNGHPEPQPLQNAVFKSRPFSIE